MNNVFIDFIPICKGTKSVANYKTCRMYFRFFIFILWARCIFILIFRILALIHLTKSRTRLTYS